MSFIIGTKCISTCDTACVDACPVDCIHGPIDIDGAGAEVATLDSVEGLQLYINPDECIECDACIPACPPDAIYEDEYTCIDNEGNDESVKKNYEFFDQEWNGYTKEIIIITITTYNNFCAERSYCTYNNRFLSG